MSEQDRSETRPKIEGDIPESTPTLIDQIKSTEQTVLSQTISDPFTAVKLSTLKHPQLGDFISEQMRDALTPSEQRLIAETALTVYFVAQTLPYSAIQIDEFTNPSPVQTIIAVEEDELNLVKKDKNSIYQLLQNNMAEYGELAGYVAEKMSGSVSLEEANLVGKAALVTFNTVKALKIEESQVRHK